MEQTVLNMAAPYGIFAVLFVLLFFYVLKTSKDREDIQRKDSIDRENRLMKALEELAVNFNIITDINKCVMRVEQKINQGG